MLKSDNRWLNRNDGRAANDTFPVREATPHILLVYACRCVRADRLENQNRFLKAGPDILSGFPSLEILRVCIVRPLIQHLFLFCLKLCISTAAAAYCSKGRTLLTSVGMIVSGRGCPVVMTTLGHMSSPPVAPKLDIDCLGRFGAGREDPVCEYP